MRADQLSRDLLSADPARIIDAVWEVLRTRDRQVLQPLVGLLPQLHQVTGTVELGGLLIPNRVHLEHALLRLELLREGACFCGAYPHHALYDPEKEEGYGHVRIEAGLPRCVDCGRQFEVTAGEGHHPWWEWRLR